MNSDPVVESRYGKSYIAIASIELVFGGIEKQYVRLANELVKRGHKVDFLLCRKSGPFIDSLDPRVSIIELTGIPVPRRNLFALISYLRTSKPDAILGGHDAINVLIVAAKILSRVRSRTVTVAHNTLNIVWNQNLTFRRRFFKVFLKQIWLKADRIGAVSDGAASSLGLLLGIPSSRIAVPYVPIVDSQMFELANEPVEEPWFQEPEIPVVLMVGRLVRAKNVGLCIQAIALLNETKPYRLIILGDGEERESLTQQIKGLNLVEKVKMPGSVVNPYAYMRKATVLVLSSDREGLPAVLIEGLAIGIPIVSTNCPSGADEILENGKWGRLVNLGDAHELAAAIAEAVKDAHEVYPESYHRFTVETSTNAYEDLLLKICF